MQHSTKIRSDLNIVQHGLTFCLLLGVKPCEPEAGDSAPAVVGSLADGADYCTEVSAVQLYESGIDVIEQNTSVAFRNFYNSWVSVFMDHSDLHLPSVIIFIQTVQDSENIPGSTGLGRSQNFNYERNETLIIWDNRTKAVRISSDFHQISPLGAAFFDLKLSIRFVSLETDGFTPANRC